MLEHVARQEDCVLLAPCGWGKTLAYFLPMVMFKHSVTVIISPLVALIQEQMQVSYPRRGFWVVVMNKWIHCPDLSATYLHLPHHCVEATLV